MNPTDFQALLAQLQRLTPLQRQQAMDALTELGSTPPHAELTDALRQWRKRVGLSQDEASAKLGVSRTLLSEIENHRRTPSRKLVQRIRDLIKVTTMNIPENDLWASVMEQALADLANRQHRQKAFLWFSSRDVQPGSFLFICDALNLDANKVLAFAKQRKMATFAVNSASSTSRVVFKPPAPRQEIDLTALQRQDAPIQEDLAQQLSRWRKERAFCTQTEAASRLGISQSSYSDIERGDKLPAEKLAQQIREMIRENPPDPPPAP
ncbi:MAG: helix-turn-helix domain-containing protein [Magnetococcales bacterium]|nr:helix-turn-helix domain-containing protein [Magnetococcales bacterium]